MSGGEHVNEGFREVWIRFRPLDFGMHQMSVSQPVIASLPSQSIDLCPLLPKQDADQAND
jgi:hypothetical protein